MLQAVITPTDSPAISLATLADTIANAIRHDIVAGVYAAGERLRQVEIAGRYGVSTTPVREAFAALAREGFVRQDSHRGVVVFSPSTADIRESFEIRQALEPLAGALAARRMNKARLEKLSGILEDMRRTAKHDMLRQMTVLNPAFHNTIYEAADQPRLYELIAVLRTSALAVQLLPLRRDVTIPAQYLREVHQEHEEIYAALAARAPRRVSRAIHRHLEHNLEQILHQRASD
jgi:DNA-binding GntR family transcriptional regulator